MALLRGHSRRKSALVLGFIAVLAVAVAVLGSVPALQAKPKDTA